VKLHIACFFIFSSLGASTEQSIERGLTLTAQCTTKRVLVVSIFLEYHYVLRVNRPPPFIPQKPIFGSTSTISQCRALAYILKTDKAIITKL